MASSSRFVPLSTDHLTANPSTEVTMQNLIDDSERLAQEAREAMPFDFGECSYSKGYLRQGVWSCLDCGEKGVCYGCSISCHSDHTLVELFTRRHFRCDCPTTSMMTYKSQRRKCALEAQLHDPNEENKYDQNFRNLFCRCGRAYDAENEKEAMIQCMSCEDWFHESCLNLLVPPAPGEFEKRRPPGGEEEDEEEAPVLIPSDTYDCLVCGDCVKRSPALEKRIGTEGWMIIEPSDDGKTAWRVIGRKRLNATESLKRPAEDEDAIIEGATKKPKGEDGREGSAERQTLAAGTEVDIEAEGAKESSALADVDDKDSHTGIWKGKRDLFLAHGVRDRLQTVLDKHTIASLSFPLDDEEMYEPPKDEDQEETLDEVTSRVVGSLPRVQAIEALHGYQTMKDRLKAMLTTHAQTGHAVSMEDIETFFEDLREQAAH